MSNPRFKRNVVVIVVRNINVNDLKNVCLEDHPSGRLIHPSVYEWKRMVSDREMRGGRVRGVVTVDKIKLEIVDNSGASQKRMRTVCLP